MTSTPVLDRPTPVSDTSPKHPTGAEAPHARALPRRLLGVWAHPDDEAYLSAGLMSRVIDAGGAVTIVTATNGEHGTTDPGAYGSAAFGEHRRAELAASLDVLGVSDVRHLDLGDGACIEAPTTTMVSAIADVITEVRPDAIVTFGPDGITGHPDHRAVSSWATRAWRSAGVRTELLYAALTDAFVDEYREVHDRIGFFDDFAARVDPIDIGAAALTCSLTERELDRKRQALACHLSQTAELADLLGDDVYRRWWRNETFRAPRPSEVSHRAAWRCGASAA